MLNVLLSLSLQFINGVFQAVFLVLQVGDILLPWQGGW